MKKEAKQHNARSAFHWQGQPSIFTQKGQQLSVRQVVESALRINLDATLGSNAGYRLKKEVK